MVLHCGYMGDPASRLECSILFHHRASRIAGTSPDGGNSAADVDACQMRSRTKRPQRRIIDQRLVGHAMRPRVQDRRGRRDARNIARLTSVAYQLWGDRRASPRRVGHRRRGQGAVGARRLVRPWRGSRRRVRGVRSGHLPGSACRTMHRPAPSGSRKRPRRRGRPFNTCG